MSTTASRSTFGQILQGWLCNLIGCPGNALPDPNPPARVAGFEINRLTEPFIPDPERPTNYLSLLEVLKHNVNSVDDTKLQVLGWFIDYRESGPDISPDSVHQLLYRKVRDSIGEDPNGDPIFLNPFFIIPASYPLDSATTVLSSPWSDISTPLNYSHYQIEQTHEFSNRLDYVIHKVPKSELEFEDEKTGMCFFSTTQLLLIKDLIRENSANTPRVIFSGYETHYGRLASPLNSDKLSVSDFPNKLKTNHWFSLKAEICLTSISPPSEQAPTTYQIAGEEDEEEEVSMAPYSALGHGCPPTWDTNATAVQEILDSTNTNSNLRNSANSSANPSYSELLRQVNQRIEDFINTGKLTDPWDLPIDGGGSGS